MSVKRQCDESGATKDSQTGEIDSLSVDGFPVAVNDAQYATASLARTASLWIKMSGTSSGLIAWHSYRVEGGEGVPRISEPARCAMRLNIRLEFIVLASCLEEH